MSDELKNSKTIDVGNGSDGGKCRADSQQIYKHGNYVRSNNNNTASGFRQRQRDQCYSMAEDGDSRDKQKKVHHYRSALTHLLCGVYALVLLVLGIVIPMSSEISRGEPGVDYYVEVFYLYIYLGSVFFLIFVHICLSCDSNKQQTAALWEPRALIGSLSQTSLSAASSVSSSLESKLGDRLGANDAECHGLSNPYEVNVLYNNGGLTRTNTDYTDRQPQFIYDRAEGVNFYLRLGAIGFATGSMIHDGFKVAQIFEIDDAAHACYGVLYMITALAHLMFTFLQTYFIFKNHKLIINKYKALMRLGLFHLVATNINVWSGTVIFEIAEDIKENFEIFELIHTGSGHATTDDITNLTTNSVLLSHSCEEETDSLARHSARFLFPCTIEYSLIAAAVVYKIYCSVGVLSDEKERLQSGDSEPSCHKAHRGLFIGLFVSILTLISISLFYVYQASDTNIAVNIFYTSEIILLLLGSMAVFLGFICMRHLHFAGNRVFVDAALLIISVFGVLVFNSFVIVSTMSRIEFHPQVCAMGLAASVLAFVESILQTVFILDGLGRCAKTQKQVSLKPGRTVITFLLMCNLSLWLINTFEMERTDTFPIHTEHYGALAWSIITHFCLPMLIFFRFHSSICLSDIWIGAYMFKKKQK